MIKFTTHKYHLPWICFNHSLKAEAIDATYNKQTSTWTAADQQQSEEIHFLLSLKTLSLILRYFSNSMLPFATVHLWPQPVTARRMLSDESLNKPGQSFCSPFSKDNSGLPETSYQTCSLSHDYLSNGLRQAYQKWPFWNKKLKLGLLFRMCVYVHTERLKWLLTSRSKNDEMGFKLMAVNTVEPFSYSHVFTTYLLSKLPARCYVCARHCKHQRSIKMSFTLSELTAVEDTYGYKKKK